MTPSSPAGQKQASLAATAKEITPDLVQRISERVLAMLIAELKIENERYRLSHERSGWGKGRRYGR